MQDYYLLFFYHSEEVNHKAITKPMLMSSIQLLKYWLSSKDEKIKCYKYSKIQPEKHILNMKLSSS